MAKRPKIPADIAREIMIEAGHRCAVCGTPCALEKAHIIPWRESKQHRVKDLICLCANCHARADNEKWGAKALREYKFCPWVHKHPSLHHPPAADQILPGTPTVSFPEPTIAHDVPRKRMIFISYSHKDEEWKNQLLRHLHTLKQQGNVDLWNDREIGIGDEWYPAINKAISKADVAVCLISADFLASDFINKEEIPLLLKRRESDGMMLLPILIWPCAWKIVPWLRGLQIYPTDATPLAALSHKVDQEQALAEIAEYIHSQINGSASCLAAPTIRWAKLPENHISIERLPKTGTDVFGRAKELRVLDDAWEAEGTNIVSFVAWGGVGKSALVNKWVDLMGKENFRGAERVYAWSFYSQGTGERVTSADVFVNDTLRWFGDSETADSSRSAWDKGLRLAELVQESRTLLLLDGIEPLQSGYEHDRGQRGQVKDPALAVLLKQLAKRNPGLCVITTRVRVTGLDAYEEWIKQKDLEQISAGAGRALLRVGGVRGTDAELEQITRDFGNHALAVNLLVPYLQAIPGRHIAEASNIPDLDIPEKEGKHPRRVMEAFAQRFGEGPELNVLYMMGLFDRPATKDEIDHLRTEPIIPGLNDNIQKLPDNDWERVVHNLRQVRLIAQESHHGIGGLDAHPLVREHFGQKLRAEHPDAWREAHNRLYEYYKALPEKELPDTLEEMAPLYLAVAHGCQAGRHQKALDEVYRPRIQRESEFYSRNTLGAFGAHLAATASFFKQPWSRPVDGLTEADKSFVLNDAGFDLRALGRLAEAVKPFEAGLARRIAEKKWINAARFAGNLSELFLALGNVARSREYAEQSVKYADDSGDPFQRMGKRAFLAHALHQAGCLAEAEVVFREAEAIQKERQPEYPLLYSLGGFQYCDLILARGDCRDAQRRAAQTLEWAKAQEILLDIGLDHLTLGRAYLMAVLEKGTVDLGEAEAHLDKAVDGLRQAGQQDDLPRGLLGRAQLHRACGNFSSARRDLDEAYEIATRGSLDNHMRLFECDCHLECCRLILAMHEAGDALTAQDIDPGSPFAVYDAAGDPLAAAREHLQRAAALIKETGYHRRDPEILLETAHLQIVEGDKGPAQKTLAAAKKEIDEMGCHRWDIDYNKLSARL